jgi:hypothetical protein
VTSYSRATNTPSWQFSTFPSRPHHWRATPTDSVPFFGIAEPSTTSAPCGSPISSPTSWCRRPRSGPWSQGLTPTKCCSWRRSTPCASAIGSTDLRSVPPSSPATNAPSCFSREVQPTTSWYGFTNSTSLSASASTSRASTLPTSTVSPTPDLPRAFHRWRKPITAGGDVNFSGFA